MFLRVNVALNLNNVVMYNWLWSIQSNLYYILCSRLLKYNGELSYGSFTVNYFHAISIIGGQIKWMNEILSGNIFSQNQNVHDSWKLKENIKGLI